MKLENITFKSLFGDYVDKNMCDGKISVCELNEQDRSFTATIAFDSFVDGFTLRAVFDRIKSSLQLSSMKTTVTFPKECFDKNAAVSLASLSAIGTDMTHYIDTANFDLKDNVLTINTSYAGVAASQNGFCTKLTDRIKRMFGIECKVICVTDEKPEEKISFPAEVKRKSCESPKKHSSVKTDTSIPPVDGLPVYLESAELVYGRKISSKNIIEMIEVSPEYSDVQVWGKVYSFEATPAKWGDKLRVKFGFSDGTNSHLGKMQIFQSEKSICEKIEEGTNILVNGVYSFDTWEKDYVINVTSIATLQEYKQTDKSERKRVELHAHTNMSAKDGTSHADELINTAFSWGHKAIAITDHGVVQAYPNAAGALSKIRKKDGDFKVIYGVEAYFANDQKDGDDIAELYKQGKVYHQILLVKNQTGMQNLYKLVSDAHLEHFHKRPITLKSQLDAHREGLIVGSACEQGELYKAIIDGASHEELLEIARYYDYLEVQPLGNNEFMIRESTQVKVDKKTGQPKPNRFKEVTSFDVIRDFNRKVLALGDELGKPVVATGDVHFLKKSDEIIRKIIMAGQGYDDFDNQAPLYFKTTDEMLSDFDYFGDRAEEIVIDNPNKIADMIDGDIYPVPPGNFPPVIEGSDDMLREICWGNAHRIYGEDLPEVVSARLEKELNGIISNGYSIMYIAAQKLVAYSEENGFLVGSRGSVGSSFAATMAGISEVNPLPPHYVCPKCQYSEFFEKGEVGSGFDLPAKKCPKCGADLDRNGHDIPFETFLGFKGDKVPDIDLNFSDIFQNSVQKYTETLFGSENVFKAGTISTIAEKTAFGFAKAYAEKKGITLNNAELNRLAKMVEKAEVKTTTGQHPAGMIVVPRDKEIYDFCPIQHPADDTTSDIITTHFDFHSIHDTILKLDELGHVVPTTYKYLEENTGIPVSTVPMSDPEVYSLFVSTEALGVTTEQIDSKIGTYALPEFNTKFTRDMLEDCKPRNFADLLQISGLSHGTGVWLDNAKDLIDNGTCTISNVIGTRDNIMVYLIHCGLENGLAFKITETVRKGLVNKGKVSPEDWEAMCNEMRAHDVPEWYIQSCGKIQYMFPKAHAAAYVIGALRLAWYKVHKPIEFYCAYFTARPEDVDVKKLMEGKDAVKRQIAEYKAMGRDIAKKEKDNYDNLLIFNEMLQRGLEILPIDIKKSHATKFLVEDGKMRLPFVALPGCGEKAAIAVWEAAQKGDFVSKTDFQIESGVSKTVIQGLSEVGAFGDMPDNAQLSLF